MQTSDMQISLGYPCEKVFQHLKGCYPIGWELLLQSFCQTAFARLLQVIVLLHHKVEIFPFLVFSVWAHNCGLNSLFLFLHFEIHWKAIRLISFISFRTLLLLLIPQFSLQMLVLLFSLKLEKNLQECNFQSYSKYLEDLCQFLF